MCSHRNAPYLQISHACSHTNCHSGCQLLSGWLLGCFIFLACLVGRTYVGASLLTKALKPLSSTIENDRQSCTIICTKSSRFKPEHFYRHAHVSVANVFLTCCMYIEFFCPTWFHRFHSASFCCRWPQPRLIKRSDVLPTPPSLARSNFRSLLQQQHTLTVGSADVVQDSVSRFFDICNSSLALWWAWSGPGAGY